MAGIARVETEAGCDKIARGNPARFQDEAQALLAKAEAPAGSGGRRSTASSDMDPASRRSSSCRTLPSPRRPDLRQRIAVQSDKLWSRFKGTGIRVPLDLKGSQGIRSFLRALFGGREDGGTAAVCRGEGSARTDPLDTWIIESHDALHTLCDRPAP